MCPVECIYVTVIYVLSEDVYELSIIQHILT
jgi:hypothetical protein